MSQEPLSRAQRFNTQRPANPAPTLRSATPAIKPSPASAETFSSQQARYAAQTTAATSADDAIAAQPISRAASFGALSGRGYFPQSRAAAAPAPVRQPEPADRAPAFDPDNAPEPELPEPTEIIRRIGGLRISASSPSAPRRPAVDYSAQQNAIIHCPAKIIVANAFAGTGKTTTAVGYAAARPNERILYLAFSKGIQEEASNRFGSNTTCRTTHSMAWGEVGRHYKDRLARPWRALVLKSDTNIHTVREAAITHSILNGYFHSADDTILPAHGIEAMTTFHAEEHEISECVAHAKSAWKRMVDRTDRIHIPDDAYLKMWALSRPKLNYDTIIFDEAQDANPVTAQIVRSQLHAKLLYIGDRHQAIYGFRGAHNAMDDFAETAKQLDLSQTWRFGPKVAEVANLLLGELKGEKTQLEGLGKDTGYRDGASVSKLARTNAQLFKDAAQRRGQGIYWVGGSANYQLDKLIEAHHLFMGKRDLIRDPFIRHFGSWADMQAYAEEAKDPEVRVLAEVVDEFRDETPKLINDIRKYEVKTAADAELVLATAHKAKGLDWDYVQLAEDFKVLAETEAELALDPTAPVPEQEINLLYVAVTRAKCMVQLNKETTDWIADLPRHRAARKIATQKAARRMSGTET